jgi:hypothetical protein
MKKPVPVYKSNRERRKISTIRGQGFKKSILQVIYHSPEGGERVLAWAEDPHPGIDHRRSFKPNPDWSTIKTWGGGDIKLQLRINLKTGGLGFRIWGHAHRRYFPFAPEDEALFASLYSTSILPLQKIGARISRDIQEKIALRRKYLYSRLKPGRPRVE